MKVLLVHPFRGDIGALDADEFMPSLACLYLAAVLRDAGHTPVLLDLATTVTLSQKNPQQYCEDQLTDALNKEQPALVGISFLFSGMFPTARKYAQIVRDVLPDAKIITGGIHATTFPEEILSNCPEFDYVGIGEGESVIVDLANRLSSGKDLNLEEIMGFAFRDETGAVHVNKERKLEKYDDLPMPAWDLIDFEHYAKPRPEFFSPKGHTIDNIVPIISTRGCPYKCTFCDLYMIQGRKVRRKGADRFVDEIEYLHKERGQNYFAFQDDNLVADRRHIIAVCEEIVRRGLDIQFETASGLHIKSLTDDVIDAMVEAGLIYAAISVEHGNDYMRNEVIQKRTDRDEIYAAVESLRRHKILIRGNWIMGYPEETNETLQDTYDMIEDLKIDRSAVLKLIPYPGTPVFEQSVRDNLFVGGLDIDNVWQIPVQPHQDEFVIKPYKLSLEEMHEWRIKFVNLRNKYFGHNHKDFELPRGFLRDAEGNVYVGGEVKPENTNKDAAI